MGWAFSYWRGTPVEGTNASQCRGVRERDSAGQCSRVPGADPPGPEGGAAEGGAFSYQKACQRARGCVHMGTSLIRERTPVEPYRRPMPRVLGGS